MVSLEEKVDKINSKQWIPVYGIYKILKDIRAGKPSIASSENIGIFVGGAVYHSLTITATTIILYNCVRYIIE